jgi:hypothetical protein
MPKVIIYDQSTGKKSWDVQYSEEEIRIMARDEARGVVRTDTDKVAADNLKNPNSRHSQAMNDYTRAGSRR